MPKLTALAAERLAEEAAEEAAPEAEELPVIDEDETVEDEVKVRVKEMADQKGWKETN